jgi:hypothetical protein
MKKLCLIAFILAWFTTPLSSPAEPVKPEVQAAVLTGRIYEAETKTGIGDLTVRLIPPRDLKQPEKVTTTDEDGKFRFAHLSGDKYLLEVYQGLTLLYREVIEVKQNTPKEIILKKKGSSPN